jgi:hypothetical protein
LGLHLRQQQFGQERQFKTVSTIVDTRRTSHTLYLTSNGRSRMRRKPKPLSDAKAYVKNKRLHVSGVHKSSVGLIPYSASIRVRGDVTDGPVNLRKTLPAEIDEAVILVTPVINKQLTHNTLRAAAEELVERARAGDQVAQATLQLVGENAQKGVPRAVLTHKITLEVLDENPPKIGHLSGDIGSDLPARKDRFLQRKFYSVIGAEEPEEYGTGVAAMLPLVGWCGVVTLANGPSLLRTGRARAVAQNLPSPQEKDAFCTGRKYCTELSTMVSWYANHLSADQMLGIATNPTMKTALLLGVAFGMAQKIQAVRQPDSRISDFDPATGWEFGE